MTPEQQKDLQTLRIAAQQREWTTLQDTLKRLLTELDVLVALQVAAAQAENFFPTFEAYYPEAGWVRELLLTVISYGSAPKDLPLHSVSQFASPGCGNFLMAVFDMARAVQSEYTVFERYSHITNGVANGILADLQHIYFSQREGDYIQLREMEGDEQILAEKRAQIQYAFWLDAQVAQRDTEIWLAVADHVEELLQV